MVAMVVGVVVVLVDWLRWQEKRQEKIRKGSKRAMQD